MVALFVRNAGNAGEAFAKPRIRNNRGYNKAKVEMWLREGNNPKNPKWMRGWVKNQWKQRGYKMRNPKGYDAGHLIPGINKADNLRPELATMNRARPGIAKRVEKRLGRKLKRR